VSGSKKPAIDGQLIILAAGDKPLYDACAGAFDIMGKRALFLGEVGAGARMKLVVNMVMGSMMGESNRRLPVVGVLCVLYGEEPGYCAGWLANAQHRQLAQRVLLCRTVPMHPAGAAWSQPRCHPVSTQCQPPTCCSTHVHP
jgi:hypothetical protein